MPADRLYCHNASYRSDRLREGLMAKTAPWHSKLEEGKADGVHHDETTCTVGDNIESYNRVPGTGGLPKCAVCRRISG